MILEKWRICFCICGWFVYQNAISQLVLLPAKHENKNVRAQKGCMFFLSDIPNPPTEKQSCHSLQGEGTCKRDFGISKRRWYPQNGWFISWKTLLKWDDLGVPLFLETPIWNVEMQILCMHSHKQTNTLLLMAFVSQNMGSWMQKKQHPKHQPKATIEGVIGSTFSVYFGVSKGSPDLLSNADSCQLKWRL